MARRIKGVILCTRAMHTCMRAARTRVQCVQVIHMHVRFHARHLAKPCRHVAVPPVHYTRCRPQRASHMPSCYGPGMDFAHVGALARKWAPQVHVWKTACSLQLMACGQSCLLHALDVHVGILRDMLMRARHAIFYRLQLAGALAKSQ